MAAKGKAIAEATALQTIQDYLVSDAFFEAIDRAVEKAVDKQLSKFAKRLINLEQSNKQIIDRLEQNDGKQLELESIIQDNEKSISRLNQLLHQQESATRSIHIALNEAEQYSRRNCLKFYGVKEANGAAESTDDTVCAIVNDRLGISLTANDIDRSHRIAAPKRDDGDGGQEASRAGKNSRPRAIIVKFTTYRKRSEILRARRRLKGTGVAIDEALTKTNQDLLWTAKRHEKVLEAWSSDGRIVVLLQATRGKTMKKVIHNKDELNRL